MTIHVAIDGATWRNERGYGRFTRGQLRALAERDTGFRYSLVCDEAPAVPVPDGVEVIIPDGKSGGRASRATVSRKLASLGADLVFFPSVYSYFPVVSRAPKVVAIHDTIPERFPDLIFPGKLNILLWQAKMRLALMQASRVLTVSSASAADIHEILKVSPAIIDETTLAADPVFRPITDDQVLATTRQELGIPAAARVLVYVGGFNRHKNVLNLIKAMPSIIAAHPDAFLVIVGRTTGDRFWDNVEELQASARSDLVASERIIFSGEIDDLVLARLLNTADALIHPSFYEGFGLPPLESMACGTPVLGSNISSIPEVVGDGGLLFDPYDPVAISSSTIRLLGDPDLAQKLSALALKRARSFTWEAGAAMTEACFRKALGQTEE